MASEQDNRDATRQMALLRLTSVRSWQRYVPPAPNARQRRAMRNGGDRYRRGA